MKTLVKLAKPVKPAKPAKPPQPVLKKRGRPAVEGNAYIDNVVFTECIRVWVESLKDLKDRKNWPVMPNYLGECFLKIADNYGNKPKFRNYTYLDEMKSEALLTCIKYAHNFNIEKSKNAFAYFTQIVHFCFLQIIAKEKVQANIRYKAISEQSIYNYNNINLHESEENG